MITLKSIEGLTYLSLIMAAVYFSFRSGEKSGSVYMLEYLRDNKFFRDSDYNRFMKHMDKEKGNR